jgi:integrase
MYLIKRKQVFTFSRKLEHLIGQSILIDSKYRHVGKNGYLRFSLNTSNKREAERLARRFAVEVDDALAQLERTQKVSDDPITAEDIRRAADTMCSSLLAADESVYSKALEDVLAGNDIERAPDRDSNLANELPPPGVKGDAELLLQLRAIIPLYMLHATGKLPVGKVDATYIPFVTAFRQVADSLAKRAQGKSIPTPPPPVTNGSSVSCTWDDLLEYYLNHHKDLSISTIHLYKRAIHDIATSANCAPAALTRQQTVLWRDQLLDKLALKTALTRLNAAHTVYLYGLRNEKLGEHSDAFDGITVAGAKRAISSRKEYSLDALQEIFRAPPSLDEIPASAGKHAAFWIPLLALFTGARREELAGLLIDEVGNIDGTIFLDFKDNKLRKLKNEASERKTPLHSELMRLGFQNYVSVVKESGAEQLFPGLVRSDGFSDWFIPHVKSRIGATGFLQDLHSFRHTFKTAARNVPLATEIHDAITGHTTPGVGSQYGSIAGVKTLKREIDKISYPNVVLTSPPMATVAEIKALAADAERRRIAGRNRTQKKIS